MIQTHPSKVIQKYMLKHEILLKINSVTDTLIINCRKFPKQIFLTILLIVALMVGLWLQFQMEIVD